MNGGGCCGWRRVLTALDKIMCLAAVFNLSASRKTNNSRWAKAPTPHWLLTPDPKLQLPNCTLHMCICVPKSTAGARVNI